MAADPSISLKVNTPDVLTGISGLVNTSNAILQYQKNQQTFGADVAQRMAESQSAQAQAQVNTANVNPLIQQQAAQTQTAQTGAELAKYRLTGEQAQMARQISQQLVSDPDVMQGNGPAIINKISQARQMMIESGVPPAMAEVNAAHMMTLAASNPKGVRQALLNSIMAGQGSAQQAGAIQPGGPAVTNNQQSQVTNVNPFAGVQQGAPVPGTAVQMQIPPTQPVFNPENNASSVYGPQGKGGPQTTPALGAVSSAEVAPKIMSDDWTTTTAQASKAQQNIGVLQAIKQYAHGAITGVDADKRAYVNGLGALLGMEPATVAKTDTDLLAKNANMLALAGGNTDMARAIAEGANPNTHMSELAIKHAADQIIAQQQLPLAKQKYMQQFVGNPQVYNQKLSEFNQVADPRAIQWSNMNLQEKSQLKSAMTPAERLDFKNKLQTLEKIGILK